MEEGNRKRSRKKGQGWRRRGIGDMLPFFSFLLHSNSVRFTKKGAVTLQVSLLSRSSALHLIAGFPTFRIAMSTSARLVAQLQAPRPRPASHRTLSRRAIISTPCPTRSQDMRLPPRLPLCTPPTPHHHHRRRHHHHHHHHQ